MRSRFPRRVLPRAVAAFGSLVAAPALAHDGGHGAHPQMLPHWGGPFGSWYGGWQQPTVIYPGTSEAAEPPAPPPQDRDEWLRQCRRRLGDNGVGGAVIGGVVGGVAGNVIAGHGNRVLGTVAGAAVGAIAGAAIDKAEDRTRTRDRCEAMLEVPGYGGTWGAAYGGGYGYAYGVPVMLVPVAMTAAPQAARGPCKETVVTEEYVTTVPRHSRVIPRRAVPDKRVRLVPDKRVPQ
jgi:hypothetical protein